MILEQFEATIEHARADHAPEGNLNTVACEQIALHYLRRIRDEHLYPDETFKAYLQRRWGITTMIDHEQTDRIADSTSDPKQPDHHQPAVVLGLDPAAPGAESTVVACQDLSRQIAAQKWARHLRKISKRHRRDDRRRAKWAAWADRWRRRFTRNHLESPLSPFAYRWIGRRHVKPRIRQIQVLSTQEPNIGDMVCLLSGRREIIRDSAEATLARWLQMTVIRKATK